MIFDELIEALSQELVDRKHSRIAALTVFAEYSPRIFEKGIASAGDMIGNYKDGSYKRKREKAGRETSFVNLEFYGTLRKDLQPTLVGKVGYAFSNQKMLDISNYLEDYYGKDIFAFTEEEQELFFKTMSDSMFASL